MEKKKRKVCFFVTLVGVIIIIIIQTIILIDDELIEKHENYIKVNVISAFDKCVKDSVCVNDTTIEKLIDDKYIDGYFLEELKGYSKESYVEYSTKSINLIKEK